VLDPAGYGPVTITNAISIVNDGVGAATIGVSSGFAITINASATDSVRLRGLTITGLGSAPIGIVFFSGGNLAIENCVVRNIAVSGIEINASTSSSFSVSNTIASNNNRGIYVVPTGSAVVTGVLSNAPANNNSNGIKVDGSASTGASLNVTIVDSLASNNSIVGVDALSASGRAAATAVMLRNVVASNNGSRLFAQTATLRVGHTVVTGNGTAVGTASGGAIQSYGDNDIDGNITNNTGLLTVIPTH